MKFVGSASFLPFSFLILLAAVQSAASFFGIWYINLLERQKTFVRLSNFS